MMIEPLNGKLRDIIEFKYAKEESLKGALQWILREKAICTKCDDEPPTPDCTTEHPEFIRLYWEDLMEGMPDLFKKKA